MSLQQTARTVIDTYNQAYEDGYKDGYNQALKDVVKPFSTLRRTGDKLAARLEEAIKGLKK